MRRPAASTLLLAFLFAHLALLPRTLEDLDSINFALGVRDFDVARHQPHPPGYPVFIALGKVSTGALRVLGIGAAAPRGLAVWSAVAGAAALPALFAFFRALEGRDRLAWWATAVMSTAPLFWFTALRPLSDMTGFAAAVGAQALMLQRTRRSIVAGALLAGLAMGVRSQTAVLTIPLLVFVLLTPRVLAQRAAVAALAMGAGVLVWGIPLLVASGGPENYLHALNAQAGEDFSGVVMLWTHHTAREAADALLNTFVWPWQWWPGFVVCVLALAGAARLAWRAPRAVIVLLAAFGPYAIFHLLFQETRTVRYALPLLPPMAYAAMASLDGGRLRLALPAGASVIAAVSLALTLPASASYAREGAPVFRALDDMAATAHGGERVDAIGMHASARRAAEWASPILPARVARAPHGREWLTLVALWQGEPGARVWFLADPMRTDLALFDPRRRDLVLSYRWPFIEPPFVGGARPDNVDWYRMSPPGWMLDRGWSLTAELGGVTARDHVGPHVAPVVAWLKRRPEEATVLIGGRYLAPPGASPTSLSLSLNGTPFSSWPLSAGYFVRHQTVPAGALASSAMYSPLEVSAAGAPHAVSLEQFDLQSAGVPMFGYDEGWYEPEFSPATGRAWRWMSERAVLWVRPVGRAVTLKLTGESPLRYYESAPHVRVLVGDREVAAFDPTVDFEQSISLAPDLLAQADGRVTLQSSRFFVPGGPGGGGDQRHLAIRIYRVRVE